MGNLYPESKVELNGFVASHYDSLMNIITLGIYPAFIRKVISLMEIKAGDKIIDFGAGTGRNACLMMKQLSGEGEITGLDISEEMLSQFKKNCSRFPNAKAINKRIDKDLDYHNYFDRAFISFALHGFPQNARMKIIRNALKTLRKNGEFFILDYNERSFKKMPFFSRFIFKTFECPYALDYIEKDWKKILSNEGFGDFSEYLFLKKYIRLLKAKKLA
jgi:ubiquinone/menaquinone biosynthesis C-methylase UbiE